jgi:AcrR family transcriptional regulator
MRDTVSNSDIRVLKTRNALSDALRCLLETRRFGKITINDICETARVSRATFYTHFVDKYDLLRFWLARLRAGFTDIFSTYGCESAAEMISAFLRDNIKLLSNMLREPDDEITRLLSDFFADTLEKYPCGGAYGGAGVEQSVLSRFCAGGFVGLIFYYVREKTAQREAISRELGRLIGKIDEKLRN